jgi:hypothetical protein
MISFSCSLNLCSFDRRVQGKMIIQYGVQFIDSLGSKNIRQSPHMIDWTFQMCLFTYLKTFPLVIEQYFK